MQILLSHRLGQDIPYTPTYIHASGQDIPVVRYIDISIPLSKLSLNTNL